MTGSRTLLILIGLVFVGTILSLIYAGNADFGGLIMIGPIPIAFGSSPEMTVIAMVIGFFIMVAFLLLGRRTMESRKDEDRTPPHEDTEDKKIKGGGVILIGPIPIVFGSDKKYTIIVMVLAIILIVLAILFLR